MKKTLIAALALVMGSLAVANAQEPETKTDTIPHIKPVFVTVFGGPTFSINENGGAFFQEGRGNELLDFQGGISAGCFFSNRYGARIALEYSNNTSAGNHDETFGSAIYGLYKYTFRSGICFADFIVNGGDMDKIKKFNWRPYFGIGAAYSFDRKDVGTRHPWQSFTDNNLCFGFRYGLMLEYSFNETFGIYLDGTHEWFTDNYNGMSPKDVNGKHVGYPLDMKLNVNFGLALHF